MSTNFKETWSDLTSSLMPCIDSCCSKRDINKLKLSEWKQNVSILVDLSRQPRYDYSLCSPNNNLKDFQNKHHNTN